MDQQQMTVALLGDGALAAALGRQLRAAGFVVQADPTAVGAGFVFVANSAALDAAAAGAASGATVVDFTPGDPDDAVALARELAARGVAFVDAPLHCEHLGRFPAEAAFLCGGPQPVLAPLSPLTAVLGRLGAPVVVCGDTGAGRVARAIVGALAVCNRMMTLEGAAMGVRNGLTVGDIGRVIERCSGSNSGTARVLPAIATGGTTSDTSLGEAATDLALCVRLAQRAYAPVLIATQACNQVLAASRTAGPNATLDDLRGLVEGGSGFSFTP